MKAFYVKLQLLHLIKHKLQYEMGLIKQHLQSVWSIWNSWDWVL